MVGMDAAARMLAFADDGLIVLFGIESDLLFQLQLCCCFFCVVDDDIEQPRFRFVHVLHCLM